MFFAWSNIVVSLDRNDTPVESNTLNLISYDSHSPLKTFFSKISPKAEMLNSAWLFSATLRIIALDANFVFINAKSFSIN